MDFTDPRFEALRKAHSRMISASAELRDLDPAATAIERALFLCGYRELIERTTHVLTEIDRLIATPGNGDITVGASAMRSELAATIDEATELWTGMELGTA